MAVKTINTELFRKMFLAGAANLEAKKEFINELNVFPVPDGDTGTNMTLTIMSAAKEVQSLENADMLTIAKAISSGSLRGARGNSGVILSQLLRGFTKEIREHKEIDAVILAKACERATATAYKAVMKPKEGTILTVAKGISRKAEELAETTEDLEVFIPEVIKYAEEVLAQTPEMLPVLKEAGVVDSGGQGLLEVIHGAYDAFLGKEIDYAAIEASGGTKMVKPSQQAEADIKFGYCTEFIIMTEKEFTDKNEAEFKAYLESIGDSIVCVADDDIVKIHVHTNDPGLAIQKALTYGQLSRMKIDNMREEHQEKLIKDAEKAAAQQASEKKKKEPRKPVGFIAVSIGEGMNGIFRELGADYIIEGGQTMNPSTDDMLSAIDEVNADHIFILPNNKNIILAANQAQSLTDDKDIIVIPTKTVPLYRYHACISLTHGFDLLIYVFVSDFLDNLRSLDALIAFQRDLRLGNADDLHGNAVFLADSSYFYLRGIYHIQLVVHDQSRQFHIQQSVDCIFIEYVFAISSLAHFPRYLALTEARHRDILLLTLISSFYCLFKAFCIDFNDQFGHVYICLV